MINLKIYWYKLMIKIAIELIRKYARVAWDYDPEKEIYKWEISREAYDLIMYGYQEE